MPLRKGDGIQVAPNGIQEVRKGDGTVIYTATTIIDDFEDGAPEWTLNGAAESASYAWSGSQSLEVQDADGEAYSTSGLPAYPAAGDVYQARIFKPSGGGGGGALDFGWQDANNNYLARHGWTDGTVELRKTEAGNVTTLASASWTGPTGEFLKGTVDWGADGTIIYDLDHEDGTNITEMSATDPTWSSGGIACSAWSGTVYYDYLRLI